MNIRGYFMLLMSTIWRTVVTQLKATFRYRVAGGADNSSLPERKGRAVFKKIYGNTVKFNQLVQNGNFADTSHWTSWSISPATLAVAGNVATIRKESSASYGGFLYNDGITPNTTHKYYLTAKLARVDASAYFGFVASSGSQGSNTMLASFTTNLDKYALITSPSSNTDKLCLRCGLGSTAINSSCKAADVMTIDLTAIFGTDAEIAAALGITTSQITQAEGVAAFEAWLALNVGTQDYYPYDEGSLISFKGQGVKSVGRNIFDGEIQDGAIWDMPNAIQTPTNNYQCSKNLMRVIGGATYYNMHNYVDGSLNRLRFVYYTANGTRINDSSQGGTVVNNNSTFTVPDNAYYMGINSAFRTPFPSDFWCCINLHDAKDGTYEPYWEDVVDLSHAYINVWDEQWELGVYNISTGEKEPYNIAIRCVNKIAVVPNTEYYATVPTTIRVIFYKSDGTYLTTTTANGVLTIPSNAYYMTFHVGNATEYAHDICINVSNADINGTYYPHALQSAAYAVSINNMITVNDVLDAGNVIKNLQYHTIIESEVGVDTSYTNLVYITFRKPSNSAGYGIYTPFALKHSSFGNSVNRIGSYDDARNIGRLLTSANTYYVWVGAPLGTTLEDAKSLLVGTYYIYELATPVVVPHDTPMQYAVDKYCTEELLVPASADGSPTSTNIVADIEYQAK